jgi:hypothetical protein
MPFKDGTGPHGAGPGSGRGRGECGGQAGGRGRGLGAGRRFGRQQGPASPQDEKSALEKEAGLLEIRLDKIRRQLAGLVDGKEAGQ